jgi:hypothetical protein
MTTLVLAAAGMHHGGGAAEHGLVEWLVVSVAVVILLCALGLALRYTVRPGETDATHIKHRILDDTDSLDAARSR